MSVSRTTPEKELLRKMAAHIAAGQIIVEEDDKPFWISLSENFPAAGPRIDWNNVPGSVIIRTQNVNYFASADAFFTTASQKANLDEDELLVVIGDSCMEVAIILPPKLLHSYLDEILQLPQHTYILPLTASWCICYSMEGNMYFGTHVR